MEKKSLLIAASAAALFTSGVYAATAAQSTAGSESAPANVSKNSCHTLHDAKHKSKSEHGKKHCNCKHGCPGKSKKGHNKHKYETKAKEASKE